MKKVINQKFEAIMRILLAVTVIFTSFGYTTSVFAASIQKGDVRNEVNTVGSTTSAGDVELKKTVEKTDEEGIYKVTLTAKGKNKVTTESQYADIYTVVVLDTSGSMEKEVCVNRPFIFCKEWADIKYPEAVKGTKVFANTLLSKYSNAQLALLTFSSNVEKARDFDNKGFDNVNYPTPNGLTNLGAAIQKADEMLAEKKKSDTNAKLYMVILSDGYPESQTVNHTIAANHAKNVTGVEIFTIGYDTDENTQKLLQGVATDANHYLNADGNNVAQKFTDIAGSIETSVPAGRNATITDTIADGFSYVEGSDNNATVDGKKISFNLDEITEEGEAVSFKIKIDKDLPTDWYPTNDKADITYTDVSDESVTKTITSSAEVYWVQETYEYRVNYYKDSINGTLLGTINGEEPKNTKINSTDIDINKYKPTGYGNGIIETNMPYEIKEEDNVIRVCYFKRDDMSYTVKYLDKNTNNELYDSEIRENKTFEEVYTETAKESPYGYRLVGNDTQEVKIDAEDKVVIFYYEKRNDFSYTVMYLEEDTNNELATPEVRKNRTYLETYSEKAKSIDGYVVDEETKEIVLEENESRIIFYYNKKDDLSYKVIYYKDSLNTDAIGEETFENQTFEDIINSDDIDKDLYKPRKGYNSGVIATDMPYTIIDGENVINVIYTKKDNLTYRVEYYYDGNIDSSKTEYFENLTYGDVITNYKEKLPADYKFVNDTAPLTIDDTEDNVIKVYYESVSKGDITPPKTGINNASYLSITCIIGMIVLSLSKKKQEN